MATADCAEDAYTKDALLDASLFGKLRWRCRRGMLENDFFLERFFHQYAATLTVRQAECLQELMALADSDLLDVFLGRVKIGNVDPAMDRADMHALLALLQPKPETRP
ncbi:succinate dehydrogenase assembly factor 2 [Candidatus Symbiobacter mobilis]|uniref:FAD assembly factor SdhE n=1 Tax=Candidatus Symbiobacter mobilis CR TaxID=946483 RepID=U5NE68_9BURK|nr:succinate dehydrogenase assembly factor 2 [Candidatus Symbiobacter mobilis]AGX88523.1 hypothetical protein Cenrod_2469 [Candidatus Symbiobacter mobilis CR]